MKIIKLVLALIFIAFAALQYNDPDPLLWMFIYGFVALLFLASAFQKVSRELILATTVGLISYSLLYLPGLYEWWTEGQAGELVEEMKAGKMYIEESREFLGLLISTAALLFLWRKP